MESRQGQKFYIDEIQKINRSYESIIDEIAQRIKRIKAEEDPFKRYVYLALLSDNFGFMENAIKCFEQALIMRPNDQVIQAKLNVARHKKTIKRSINEPFNALPHLKSLTPY